MSLSKYTKTITAVIGIAAMIAYQFSLTHPNHWISVALGVLTAFGVFQLPNTTPTV